MGARCRTRGLVAFVAAAVVASMLLAVPVSAAPTWTVAPSTNPVFSDDAPDPHVVRFGSAYYAYTTGTWWGNRIGVLKSSSPASGWQPLGSALAMAPGWQEPDTQNAPGVFRLGGTYLMYYNAKAFGRRRCLSVAASSSPGGPFVDNSSGPLACMDERGGAIDASPFIDANGRPYLYWKNNDGFDPRHPAVSSVWVAPLSANGLQVGTPQLVMSKDDSRPPGNTVDNPQMVRANGAYFLFFTGGDWETPSYSVGYAVCSSPAGPCTRPDGPLLSSYGSVAGPGGGTVFTDNVGRFWLSYHAYDLANCANGRCVGPRRLFIAPMRQPFSWSPWERLGGDLVGNPAAASQKTNRLDVFARSTDGKVWRKQWNGASWTGWGPLGGTPAGDPTAVSRAANRLDVFVRGTDGRLWRKVLVGSSWSAWVRLAGVVAGDPAVASWGANRLDLFVRGSNNQLQHKSWNGSGWSSWESLGGAFKGDPAAVSWAPGRLDVFVRGTDDQLRHKWWNGTSWSGWEALGGILNGDPAVASWAPGRLDVFVRGTDDRLYQKAFGGDWSGWKALGSGVLAGDPAAASWAAGRIDVFARSNDNQLLHKYFS